MPDFGIFRGFNEKLFGDKLYAGQLPINLGSETPVFEFIIDTRYLSSGSTLINQFKLPLTTSTGLNCTVDWGDGTSDTITSHTAAETTHTYTIAGIYTIRITGLLPGWRFGNSGDRLKFLNVNKWGILNITTNAAFWGCSNFNSTAIDAPLITTTSFDSMFGACTTFNGSINNWNVFSVTNMSFAFSEAFSFNQNLNQWNVSNVTTMLGMFQICRSFNQDIGSWNTSNVTTMANMFFGATLFNNGNSPFISKWDTSKVVTMANMFNSAILFNQDISDWNISNVTNFASFMLSKSIYAPFYLDNIYNKWSLQSVKPNISISFGTIK
jgi:surface protein